MTAFTESIVEEALLDWLRELGYLIIPAQDVLPAAGDALRANYGDVVFPGAQSTELQPKVSGRVRIK